MVEQIAVSAPPRLKRALQFEAHAIAQRRRQKRALG